MNKESQIFNIKAIHYEGWELHVKAENFEEAYEFIDKLRKGENVDFKQMEFDLDAPTRIEKIVDVKSEKPTIIFDNTEGVSMDKELKYGYDCDSEKYIMTLVTEYIQNRNVEAENKEQAIKKIMSDNTVNFGQAKKEDIKPLTILYSNSEEERLVVGEKCINVKEVTDFTNALIKEFPNGLTVRLENDSLENLREYQTEIEKEFIELQGMIEPGEMEMGTAKGKLKLELELEPKDYNLLYPCKNTYYSNEMSNELFDLWTIGSSVLLSTAESMKQARIQCEPNKRLLNYLKVEGIPYWELMDAIVKSKYVENDDNEVIYYANRLYADNQPEYKRELAKEATKTEVNAHWMEKVKPTYTEHRKLLKEYEEQAAKENGYKNAAEWKRDFEWGKYSDDVIDKMRRTEKRFNELYKPVYNSTQRAARNFEMYRLQKEVDYIKTFNRMVTEANVKLRNGNYYISCKVDGVQQCTKPLNAEYALTIINAKGNKEDVKKLMAESYYSNEIKNAISQKEKLGISK